MLRYNLKLMILCSLFIMIAALFLRTLESSLIGEIKIAEATSPTKYFVDELIEKYDIDVEVEENLKQHFEQSNSVNVSHLPLAERRRRMELAMKIAAAEFDVPYRLLQGIAGAESSYGSNFYNQEDVNCFNWWGTKTADREVMKVRISEGSWLRCYFNELAGARTQAKMLKNFYL